MKVALISPWENVWVPQYRAACERRGHDFILCKHGAPKDSDIVLHGWASGTPPVVGAVNIVILRRFELYAGGLVNVDWTHTNALICVNEWVKIYAENMLKEAGVNVPMHLVYNAVDESRWTFAEHKPGKKVGMACFIHSKKNLPLAIQILAALPEGYELHIAGGIQDASIAVYMQHIASRLGKVLQVYEQIPGEAMDKWWDQMDYCLSTSITEGNPNNVNEAMAKGIKPVVHNWPGSEEQYGPWIFASVQQAVDQIVSPEYDSHAYREWVRKHFSSKNIERVLDIAESMVAKETA